VVRVADLIALNCIKKEQGRLISALAPLSEIYFCAVMLLLFSLTTSAFSSATAANNLYAHRGKSGCEYSFDSGEAFWLTTRYPLLKSQLRDGYSWRIFKTVERGLLIAGHVKP